jgi:P2 family phage contractile tail tube protein
MNFSFTNGSINLITQSGKIGLQGVCKEFKLPTLTFALDDDMRLGYFGTAPVVTGMEPIEGSIKIAGWSDDWVRESANWKDGFQFQIIGSLIGLQRGVKTNSTLLIAVNAIPSELSLGELKAGESMESEITYMAHYVSVSRNNVSQLTIDVQNNIYRIGENDLLAQFRESIA